MSFTLVLNSILLGIGLAMDAFSVSLANGLNEPDMSKKRMCGLSCVFGIFQTAMPMIGWICVHTIVTVFSSFEKLIPWIALILLGFIGGKMLIEGIRGGSGEDEETAPKKLTVAAIMVQGIATSIDALSVGFTISEYSLVSALTATIIIGAVTFAICVGGTVIGKKVGMKLAGKANILGGVILIAIGIEIFLKGILG